jgi:hypothetical protein
MQESLLDKILMKRLVYFLIVGILVCCLQYCSPSRNLIIPEEIGSEIVVSEIHSFSRIQFDSMCLSEKLPNDISKWIPASFRDYETKDLIQGLMILRPDNSVKQGRLITFLTSLKINQKDTTFVFEKRRTELKK